MTVLLVLFFFATFLAIDYFRTRHAFVRPALQVAPAKHDAVAPRLQPAVVGGFAVPENLRYHPGHTWALSESPNLVRVGMDDFASKLTGTIENITLPQRGQWIRQGQKMCTLYRDDYSVDMVSPNPLALANPLSALRQRDVLDRGFARARKCAHFIATTTQSIWFRRSRAPCLKSTRRSWTIRNWHCAIPTEKAG